VDVVLLASRMTLAVVLLVAVLAKVFDPSGTRDSLERFGVPARLVRAASVVLPLVELGVAVALVPVSSAWAAAVVALVLLLAFTAALRSGSCVVARPVQLFWGDLGASVGPRARFQTSAPAPGGVVGCTGLA
jgi:uncharacterized membrane protein YphA (DoxX/SURF4 family)